MTDHDQTTIEFDLDAYAAAFVELWNEPDLNQRRAAVCQFWASEGANYTPTIEAVGHDEIVSRVTRSYEKNIGPGTFRFRQLGAAKAHHDVVTVQWEMIDVATDRTVAGGVEFLVLDDQHRIVTDHQFIVG